MAVCQEPEKNVAEVISEEIYFSVEGKVSALVEKIESHGTIEYQSIDETIMEGSKLEVLPDDKSCLIVTGHSEGVDATQSKIEIIKTTSITAEMNGHVESTNIVEKQETLVTVNELTKESISDTDTSF